MTLRQSALRRPPLELHHMVDEGLSRATNPGRTISSKCNPWLLFRRDIEKRVSVMSPFKCLFAAAAAALVLVTPAAPVAAQRVPVEQSPATQRQEGAVRVQSSITMFVAGPTGEGEEAQKLRDRGRRLIYDLAARECDLLREAIARDCKLESISSNINRQSGAQQQEGYNINGSMSFQIMLK
jgi:hypothetical protein